jgi:hypothetical protein
VKGVVAQSKETSSESEAYTKFVVQHWFISQIADLWFVHINAVTVSLTTARPVKTLASKLLPRGLVLP